MKNYINNEYKENEALNWKPKKSGSILVKTSHIKWLRLLTGIVVSRALENVLNEKAAGRH